MASPASYVDVPRCRPKTAQSVSLSTLNQQAIRRQGAKLLVVFAVFVALQTLLSSLALRMEGEDPRLAFYAPLFVVGYRQFCDLVTLRSIVDVLFDRDLEWTSPDRIAESPGTDD